MRRPPTPRTRRPAPEGLGSPPPKRADTGWFRRFAMFLAFLAPLYGGQTNLWQEKVVLVGTPFRITIAAESPDDTFLVSELNPAYLSNGIVPKTNAAKKKAPANPAAGGASNGALEPAFAPLPEDEALRSFLFTAVQPGLTFLGIDRLRGNSIEKKFLYYRITILPDSQQEAITRAIARKKAEQKQKMDEELAAFLQARQLATARYFESALRELDAYLAKYPAGSMAHQAVRLKGDVQILQTNYAGAVATYGEYLKKGELKDSQRADALASLGEAYLSNKQPAQAVEQYLRLATRYKDSPRYPESLLALGALLSMEKRWAAAFPYFEAFYQLYRDKNSGLQTPRMDEAVFGMAQVYENEATLRDMNKAVEFYKMLLDATPFSALVPEAKKRIRYLQRNFLDVH